MLMTSGPPDSRAWLAYLRSLRRIHRALQFAIAAPPALLLPAIVTLSHFGKSRSSALLTVLVALFALGLFHLAPLAITIKQWTRWSLAYRREQAEWLEIDWADRRWAPVLAVISASGMDMRRARAVAEFSDTGNLRTIHLPRLSPGRMGSWTEWSEKKVAKRRYKPYLAGAAIGVTAAVLNTVFPAWVGSPAVTVVLVVLLIAAVPVAIYNAAWQLRFNVARAENIIVIPIQWRVVLRRGDPGGRAIFLHELSHARNNDSGHRRFLISRAAIGAFLVFLETAVPNSIDDNIFLRFAIFVAMAICGIAGVIKSACVIPTIPELRADAEAAIDDESVQYLINILNYAQSVTPHKRQATRLCCLKGAWHAEMKPFRRAADLVLAGFVVPLLVSVAALWTGVMEPAPAFRFSDQGAAATPVTAGLIGSEIDKCRPRRQPIDHDGRRGQATTAGMASVDRHPHCPLSGLTPHSVTAGAQRPTRSWKHSRKHPSHTPWAFWAIQGAACAGTSPSADGVSTLTP
jgi:hypothetical protein